MVAFSTLTACATNTVFDPRACPQERKYTRAEQQRLLNELPRAGPMTRAAILDYGKLRDQARACRGETVPGT